MLTCQGPPAVYGMAGHTTAGDVNMGQLSWNKMISVCQYWELGGLVLSWDGYLEWSITWLVLMSLSASRAQFLITTELSSCITITESIWHSKVVEVRGDNYCGGPHTVGIMSVRSWGRSLWITIFNLNSPVPMWVCVCVGYACVLSLLRWFAYCV